MEPTVRTWFDHPAREQSEGFETVRPIGLRLVLKLLVPQAEETDQNGEMEMLGPNGTGAAGYPKAADLDGIDLNEEEKDHVDEAEEEIMQMKRDIMYVKDSHHNVVKKMKERNILGGYGHPPPCCCLRSLLFVLVAVPVVAFVATFSAIGEGRKVYKFARNNNEWQYYLVGGSCSAVLLLWVLDADLWNGCVMSRVRQGFLVIIAGAFSCGVILYAESYPYGPLCLFVVGLPVYLICFYQAWLTETVHIRYYMGALPYPLLLCSGIVMVYWVNWTWQDDNSWTEDTRIEYARDVGCELEDDDDDYSSCLDAFMIWFSPFAVAGATGLMGLITYVLDDNEEHKSPKYFGYAFLVILFALWVGASLGGAGSAISEFFTMFTMAGLMALAFTVLATFGMSGLTDKVTHDPAYEAMVEKYGAYGDVFRGMFIVTCLPLLLVYLVISFINQTCRRLGCTWHHLDMENRFEEGDLVTRRNTQDHRGTILKSNDEDHTYEIEWHADGDHKAAGQIKKVRQRDLHDVQTLCTMKNLVTQRAQLQANRMCLFGMHLSNLDCLQLKALWAWNWSDVLIYAEYWGIAFMVSQLVTSFRFARMLGRLGTMVFLLGHERYRCEIYNCLFKSADRLVCGHQECYRPGRGKHLRCFDHSGRGTCAILDPCGAWCPHLPDGGHHSNRSR